MKKIHLLIGIIMIVTALAGLDYTINYSGAVHRPNSSDTSSSDLASSGVEDVLKKTNLLAGYQLLKKSRTQNFFEKVGFAPDQPFVIFHHLLQDPNKQTLEIDELRGPEGQGNLTYFKLKQQFLTQVVDATSHLNESKSYGHNSFFYNDLNYPKTAFLAVQINDAVYGFKYSKDPVDTFETIKKLVQYLMATPELN